MTSAESLGHARQYLRKAQEYLASAQDNLDLERLTPAVGDAIHAGISANDAVVTALTGATRKSKDHGRAATELRQALAGRPDAASRERDLRDLISHKSDVEYGTKVPGTAVAMRLMRRARALVELAEEIIHGY